MPIMRNPFKKQDENVRPARTTVYEGESVGPLDIKEKNPVEYKLSEINDSGVYLPPSPTERKSFWGTTSSRSTTSSSIHRCAFDENEPFNISRESFDSYRRSFDISARSPIISPESRGRASLDSRTFLPPPRLSNSFNRGLQVPPQTQEEEGDRFEDVNIDDPKPPPPHKKRGILARIVDSGSNDHDSAGRPTSSHENNSSSNKSSWHHFGGRKRGQSGQGAELGSIVPKREETPKPEKQQQQIVPDQVGPLPPPAISQQVQPQQQPSQPKQLLQAQAPSKAAPPTQPVPPRAIENIPPKETAAKAENTPATVAPPAAAQPAAMVEIKVDS